MRVISIKALPIEEVLVERCYCLLLAEGRLNRRRAVRSDAAEHSDAAGARRIVEAVAAETSVQEEVNEGAMSEKSLRAKAIRG